MAPLLSVGHTGRPEELFERCDMLNFASYKTTWCAECRKEPKEIPGWLPLLEAVWWLSALMCVSIMITICQPITTLFVWLSITIIGIITTSYVTYGRRLFIYPFKDSQGRWHTHVDEPQKKCGAHICMADFIHAEDMIIKNPIWKIQVRGWGRKRHEILNGYYGNWKPSDFHCNINCDSDPPFFSVSLTLDNGTTRQKRVELDRAHKIIQSRYQPVCALAEYDADELAYLQEIATSYEVMRTVTGDIVELIERWKGSSESKIGMSARIMLERLRQCAAVNIHDQGGAIRAKVEKKTAEPKQVLLRAVTSMIKAEATRSPKLRDFVASKPQYLPPDEKSADTAGEAKAS